jgi:hypothetical protein
MYLVKTYVKYKNFAVEFTILPANTLPNAKLSVGRVPTGFLGILF